MSQYSVVVVEKYKDRTDVRELNTYSDETQANEFIRSRAWRTNRPYVVETSKLPEFVEKYEVKPKPQLSQEEAKAKYEKQKAYEKELRLREKAGQGDVTSANILYSKYGIKVKPKEEQIVSEQELELMKEKEFERRFVDTSKKVEQSKRISEIVPRLKFETAKEARAAGYEAKQVQTQPLEQQTVDNFKPTTKMISAGQPVPFYKDPYGKTYSAIEQLELKGDKGSATALRFGVGVASYGYGYTKGFVGLLNPKTYTRDIPQLAKDVTAPFRGEYLPEIGIALRTQPERVIPEFAGYAKGFSKGIETYSALGGPRITAESVGNRKVLGVDYGLKGGGVPIVQYVGKSVAEVKKITPTGEVIISSKQFESLPFKVPEKSPSVQLGKGTPTDYVAYSEFEQPRTGAGTRVFESNIKEYVREPSTMLVEGETIGPELQREFALRGIQSTRELATTKSPFYTAEDLISKGTERLNPIESEAIYYGIGKEKGKVFGSYAARAEVKPEIKRQVGDIEGTFETFDESLLATKTQNILGYIKETGTKSKFRILEEEPYHIEKFIGNEWVKVAEFKGKGIGDGDVAAERAFGFDLWTNRDFTKRLGVRTAMLRGELKRKTAASIGIRNEEFAIGVTHTGRFKDVPDYFRYAESLSYGKIKPKTKKFLELKEELGIEYDVSKPIRYEIEPSRPSAKLSRKSPSISPTTKQISSISSKGSPRKSVSPSPSISRFASISPSPSPRKSVSPSPSPSRKFSISPYTSPSPRGSPSSSPSISKSPSPYKYTSPSPSPSPSPVTTGPPPTIPTIKLDGQLLGKPKPQPKGKQKRKFRGTPSLPAIFGGVGSQLSKGQIKGTEYISPFTLRKL